jgi:hypothetical protein
MHDQNKTTNNESAYLNITPPQHNDNTSDHKVKAAGTAPKELSP